jgi:hypothetical protein
VQVRAAVADRACRRVSRQPPWCFVRCCAMKDSHGQSSHARARGCLGLQTAGHGLAPRSAAASLSLRRTFPRPVMSCTPDPPRDSAPAFTHLPSANNARRMAGSDHRPHSRRITLQYPLLTGVLHGPANVPPPPFRCVALVRCGSSSARTADRLNQHPRLVASHLIGPGARRVAQCVTRHSASDLCKV